MNPADQPQGIDSTGNVGSVVRSVEIAGATMVIETFSDGRVLVNGELVEPVDVTKRELGAMNSGDKPPREGV